MGRSIIVDVLLGTYWRGWRRIIGWMLCLTWILLLGLVRITTDAEYSFASLALLPLLLISWLEGRPQGLLVGILAATMWVVGDIAADRSFSAWWVPWANATTRLTTYGLVAVLTSQVRSLYERERERATHDVLTGLSNRRSFLEAGDAELERSKRYGHSVSVIFLDLDDFKQINDVMGHEVGDAALRATAAGLLGSLRNSDHVARLGGDEFAVLLPEISYDAALETGRKIFEAVNSRLSAFPPVKTSLGVAWFGEIDRSFPAMLKNADELMYEVKTSGKGNIRSRQFSKVGAGKASN